MAYDNGDQDADDSRAESNHFIYGKTKVHKVEVIFWRLQKKFLEETRLDHWFLNP